MKKSVVAMLLGLLFCQGAYAITIGADRLLGTIEPGTPANLANEMVMVNGLLNGWEDVAGYNDGAAPGIMGDNPADPNRPKKNPKLEVYTLRYSASTVLPPAGTAPLAVSGFKSGEDPSAVIHLGSTSYDWVLAKWGKDSAVYYIGDMTGDVELTLGGTGWDKKRHGLSHYSLFNGKPPDVPDGGLTIGLLGMALGALGLATKKIRP